MFFSATRFGSLIAIFSPDGLTLEEYNVMINNIDLNTIEKPLLSTDKVLPLIPSYLEENMDLIMKMVQGIITVSTNSVGVSLTSILTAYEAINSILKKKPIITVPQYVYIDLLKKMFAD